LTVPREVLKRLDQRARELDRPRSWVMTEAVRAWLDATAAPRPSAVRERSRSGYGVPAAHESGGLGDQRLSQLRADLALTPEQRVIEGERTAKAVSAQATRWSGMLSFERFEDFWAWKRRETLGR
jgi:predicted transcriptional regulator